MCVSLAASGDLDGLEIWSIAGADLNKAGYDGHSAIQVVGLRGGLLKLHFCSVHKVKCVTFHLSQAQAVGKKEVVTFLVHLMTKKSKVSTVFSLY